MADASEDMQRLCRILTEDDRYAASAYAFVQQAVAETCETLTRDRRRANRHITAEELLDGIRSIALRDFGPMAYRVFQEWGIRNTLDFGYIVFTLERNDLLGLSEEDSLDQFRDVYDFETAFRAPYKVDGPLQRPPVII